MDNLKHGKNSNLGKHTKLTLLSVLIGEVVTILLIMLFSIVMCKIDIPILVADMIIIFVAALGGFIAGYMNGRMIKEKGMLYGAACGTIMALLLLIMKLIFCDPVPTWLTLAKLLLMVVLSAVGGIVGVNKKSKRIKY
ncbi:TIGR04086 family membrane protein [Paludicola sp. MB14-C6]|uniref:TIGR04086 family membrane protein n=1 Tax=Paludihabitans sp. MB14-C6 TaxID=3070656 RepID=UPI0027DB8014|nr:TIGR04086 family membrane protein [Paludicola sp. MB14-C6]WMJ23123.1 TIGR04086 family membrane protein [Paludicola sp. MB14-C6]